MMDSVELLGRFHSILVQEIRQAAPRYLDGPFTVAEIYQDLVPYRSHRDAIGVEMNGDYEDALLRLLAGEGDFLILESGVAQRALREELQNSNPNTGLFRDFAAVDVRLNPDKVDAAIDEPPVDQAPEKDGDVDEAPADEAPVNDAPADEAGEYWPVSAAPVEVPTGVSHTFEFESTVVDSEDDAMDEPERTAADEVDTPEVEGSTAESCQWCAETLPGRSVLNFCPHCGGNLMLKPCTECGEELEAGWGFCPACGDRVG